MWTGILLIIIATFLVINGLNGNLVGLFTGTTKLATLGVTSTPAGKA